MAVDKRSTRLGVLATVSLLLLGALGTRIWFLQGTQQAVYQSRVTAAKTRTEFVPPERGRIFDADGRVLADNKRLLTVTIEWALIRNRTTTRRTMFERLSGPLEMPVSEMEARYDSQRYSPYLPLPLKEGISEATVNFLLERSEDFPGVNVTEQWRRVYPYAPLASHVVGYLGAITTENVDQYMTRGYNTNERVGQFGIELQMESQLHGTWGKRVFEIDAAGNVVRELHDEFVAPVAGQDIQLTIDLDVQQYAEQALETELRQRRSLPDGEEGGRAHNPIDPESETEERVFASSTQWGTTEWVPYKAPAGSVVVMNHSNGDVIAMASYPTFDNRWQESGISGEKYKQIFPDTDDPDQSILVNRAIQGRYNLGSSIKPFIAWSALHSGLIASGTTFLDEGTYTLRTVDPENCQHNGGESRCIFKNATSATTGKPTMYGEVTVESALAVSSDAFFYRLGEEFYDLDENLLKANLRRFGFGADTGIALPYEWDGRVPDDAVKRELVEKKVLLRNEVPRLTVGDNVQVAIGQGLMAATPLQMANAYSALANNGGFVWVPQIVKAIYAPLTPDADPSVADLEAGTVVEAFDRPEFSDQLEMPGEVRLPIIAGLSRVITGPGTVYPAGYDHFATGFQLFQPYPYEELPIAGKTGTAQGAGNYPWNDSSAFGAFSLDDTQPWTVFAYLEKSGYGAKAAAPVTKCIFTALAGITPMDEVVVSDPLDLTAITAAPERELADPTCLGAVNATTARD